MIMMMMMRPGQGRNHWGVEGSGLPPPKKSWTDHPNFLRSSARNWVYYPYFVLYNNLHQGIGPPTLKTWLRPWAGESVVEKICERGRFWAGSERARELWVV